ncbi:TetR/AcrR family transcriptional regulator [Acinetobacter brisouii]|uniref:TetR/AcrR family transcriptional regulator n=1 Tax=Acinetobacter brisouii TaxID=396323 RepID=UPI0005F7C100|nr:TetR/AcrR family transcriptional regulator [Acinetobacter brisouii]KJV37917.1 TetR family transcriptional regulator [Acinetobacter brisouii]
MSDQLYCYCNVPPQTKRGFERHLAFVISATELFLEKGYDAVSLDDIVNHAGGSKASLYKYFGNKDGLFKAICEHRRDIFFKELFLKIAPQTSDLKSLLVSILNNFYQHILKPENRKFVRLLFEQTKQNPELAIYLYEECPGKILHSVSQRLSQAHEQGQIVCSNPLHSAKMYLGILWHFEWQVLMGVEPQESLEEISDYIEYSVEHFLKALQYR